MGLALGSTVDPMSPGWSTLLVLARWHAPEPREEGSGPLLHPHPPEAGSKDQQCQCWWGSRLPRVWMTWEG